MRPLQKKQSVLGRAWERCVARLFCGPQQPEAEWVTADSAGHMRFIARHGVLFEDNKGAVSTCSASRHNRICQEAMYMSCFNSALSQVSMHAPTAERLRHG